MSRKAVRQSGMDQCPPCLQLTTLVGLASRTPVANDLGTARDRKLGIRFDAGGLPFSPRRPGRKWEWKMARPSQRQSTLSEHRETYAARHCDSSVILQRTAQHSTVQYRRASQYPTGRWYVRTYVLDVRTYMDGHAREPRRSLRAHRRGE